jgi:hypothetical protein
MKCHTEEGRIDDLCDFYDFYAMPYGRREDR